MAVMSEKTCIECGKRSMTAGNPFDLQYVCTACKQHIAGTAKRLELDGLADMPLEHRLARLEEQLYDLQKQLESLAASHNRIRIEHMRF